MPSIPDHTPGGYSNNFPGRFPDNFPDRCPDRFPDPFPSRPTGKSRVILQFRPTNEMRSHLPVLSSFRGKQTGTILPPVPPPAAGETTIIRMHPMGIVTTFLCSDATTRRRLLDCWPHCRILSYMVFSLPFKINYCMESCFLAHVCLKPKK